MKSAALVAIGVLGAVHRRRTIRSLAAEPGRRGPFWTLVLVELAVMGVASGFAVALGRTATPVDQVALSKDHEPVAGRAPDRRPAAP